MKICLSTAPNSMRETLKVIRGYHDASNIIEVRIDGIKDLNLAQLLQHPRPKLIITNRRRSEGGKFIGSANQQFEILSETIRLGAEYVDVEYSWGDTFVNKIISQSKETKIICSYHNFEGTQNNLDPLYRLMRKTGAHIIKIATTAKGIADNKVIFDLMKAAHKDRQKIIALCMGEAGQISRILGGKFGNYLTYASLSDQVRTADGQLTYDELKNIYHADKLNHRTKIFGLVGNPVKHSKGIYFHNEVFSKKLHNAVYVNFLVNDLRLFLSAFQDLFSGLSITMPFKEEIAPLIDKVYDDASQFGVFNTVIKRRSKLVGFNTDLDAISSLVKKHSKLNGKEAAVLGTGATAKTMVYSSMRNGYRTTIIGRDSKKLKILAREIGCEWTTFDKLHSLNPHILMNGTSVGMKGNPVRRIVHKEILRKDMLIIDAVYNPVMTPLLQDAVQTGCKIITGLELFEKQAKLQSKYFIDCMK
ncbi:MAG: type I 3-dehydroquinate dehydratase [Ignavibacteriales bacterium]|nr:type I 3-dehydroquinate dehydratase [Ignavibacteriales bacterium]